MIKYKEYEFIKDFPLGPKRVGDIVKGEKVGNSSYVSMEINGKTTAVPYTYLKELRIAVIGGKGNLGSSLSTGEQSALDKLLNADSSFAPDVPIPQVPEVPEVEPEKPQVIKLKRGEFLLSTVMGEGGSLPMSGKDVVMRKYPKGTWTPKEDKDIPKVDKMYKWDPDLLEKMWLSHELNENMLLTGFPGTGKSTAVRQFAAWIRQPLMKFNGKDGMEASSFLGNLWAGPAKTGMEWKDGLLPIAIRAGYLVTIDEVFKIPPGIAMALQELYEEDGCLRLDDNPDPETKVVRKHPKFRIMDTDNAKGVGDNFEKFSTTHVQDTAKLDRYGITATVDYLRHGDETKMLQGKYKDVSGDIISQLVRFAGLIRTGYAKSTLSLVLSPRGLQCACKLLGKGVPKETALDMVYIDKLGEPSEIKAAQDLLGTAF